MTEPSNRNNSNLPAGRQGKNLLIRYAAIGTQLFAGLLIFVFVGKWIDEKLKFSFPVFIWLLPLLFLLSMIFKVVKDTSNKK